MNKSELEQLSKLPLIDENLIKIGGYIGCGKSGNVYRGTLIDPNDEKKAKEVAVKELRSSYKKAIESNTQIMYECLITFSLDHENILKFFYLCERKDQITLIIMEYCAGNSLSSYLYELELPLPLEVFISWSIQIAKGMLYLHSKDLMHCDLKCQNILLSKQPIEYSDMLNLKLKIANISSYSKNGTPTHMSPEAIKNKFSKKSDIWSFGVCLWEMIYRKMPFYSFESFQILYKVAFKHETLEVGDDCLPWQSDLLNECWNFDENNRPSFDQIIERLKKFEAQYK